MLKNLFDVEDKIVIVTGGWGQLGREFTSALSARGARVAVFDIVAGETSDFAFPERILAIEADVTSRDSIEAGLKQVTSAWGVPHALINNAGLDSPPDAPIEETGPFESYPESSWDKVMEVNSKGVFLCCQVIGGAMANAGRGSIVNINSIYGLISPDQRIYEYRRAQGDQFFKPVAYSASKSSLLNLTRYLATYWAAKNVRVNSLTLAGVFNDQDSLFLKSYTSRVPLGRMAEPEDYVGAIVFLVSEASSYMTGANMVIDGGWTAW